MKATGTIVTLEQIIGAVRSHCRKANRLASAADAAQQSPDISRQSMLHAPYRIGVLRVSVPCTLLDGKEQATLLGFSGLGLTSISGDARNLIICLDNPLGDGDQDIDLGLEHDPRPTNAVTKEDR